MRCRSGWTEREAEEMSTPIHVMFPKRWLFCRHYLTQPLCLWNERCGVELGKQWNINFLTVGGDLDTGNSAQMPCESMNFLARWNVPHNQIAIFRARYHLAFVINRDGNGENGIGMTNQHLFAEHNSWLASCFTFQSIFKRSPAPIFRLLPATPSTSYHAIRL